MFALIDCNNFYVSCERIFRPDLTNKPLVVLSNNDGCVISRSLESKKLGIKMGEPYFKIKNFIRDNKIHVFSSNYALYGDISARIMSIIESSWPETEVYSIDEAFLDLRTLSKQDLDLFCSDLQRLILKCTGVPTSIGIGETKTLAKVANHLAKKHHSIPIFNICGKRHLLNSVSIQDVWGIGSRSSQLLKQNFINNALEFSNAPIYLIRQLCNILLQKTYFELQGKICLDLNEISPKKSIVSSASFGEMQNSLTAITNAISYHCTSAWQKLRKQKSMAGYLSIFIKTNKFRVDHTQYVNSIGVTIPTYTDDLQYLHKLSCECLTKIFKAGLMYKKCGIMLGDLIAKKGNNTINMLVDNQKNLANEPMMHAIEAINAKYGSRKIYLASEGIDREWAMKSCWRTPKYTTNWDEIPIAYC